MHKRVKNINKYYINLEYEKDKETELMESIMKLNYLSLELKFKDTDDIATRFLNTASLIEKNLNFFMSVCEHVDVIPIILDYFYFFGSSFMLDAECVRYHETAAHILLTIYNMYQECTIQLFLEDAIIEESQMEWYNGYKQLTPKQIGMMIIFEDSDLHAVINYLKFKRVVSCLNKIWVQKSIIQTFMWYFKKYVGHLDVPIQIFHSKQELLTPIIFKCNVDKDNVLNIVSIWSEDVTAAKNLARSLNQQVIFINTHMDVSPDIVFPYTDIISKSVFLSFNLHTVDEYVCTNSINPTTHKGLIYDLFYDGMWQKPKKNTYWIYNNILLANATRYKLAYFKDIIECIESATKGFKTWNIMSSETRKRILFKFAATLECNGKFSLSNIIYKWVALSNTYGEIMPCSKTKRFEIIKVPKPQGTVILKEKDEITLFEELTQSLIIGNSIIMICNPDLCLLAPYCNMFKMSGIPPGVINLMSSENTQNINCYNFENLTSSEAFEAFTKMQYILVSRK